MQSGSTFNTLDDTRATLVLEALLTEVALDDAKQLLDVPVDELIRAQLAASGPLGLVRRSREAHAHGDHQFRLSEAHRDSAREAPAAPALHGQPVGLR